MARRYTRKPGLALCVIPGVGAVKEGQVLEGDQYARFCPGKLVEVTGAPPSPPEADRRFVEARDGAGLRSDATVKVPVPVPESEPEPPAVTAADSDAPSMEWRKAELVAYATAEGIEVEGMTKAEILEAITGAD